MPSPVGHALAGLAIAWTADATNGLTLQNRKLPHGSRVTSGLALACAGLAALPDVDLALPIAHRTATHSVTAVIIVWLLSIIAGGVTGKVTARTALIGAAAYASHLLLDWLQTDPTPPFGIQLLWPMSTNWFISGWNVFRATERRHLFELGTIARNILAVAQEIAIMLPVAAAAWVVRRRGRELGTGY